MKYLKRIFEYCADVKWKVRFFKTSRTNTNHLMKVPVIKQFHMIINFKAHSEYIQGFDKFLLDKSDKKIFSNLFEINPNQSQFFFIELGIWNPDIIIRMLVIFSQNKIHRKKNRTHTSKIH